MEKKTEKLRVFNACRKAVDDNDFVYFFNSRNLTFPTNRFCTTNRAPGPPVWRAININPFLSFSVSLRPVLAHAPPWSATVDSPASFRYCVVNNYYTNKNSRCPHVFYTRNSFTDDSLWTDAGLNKIPRYFSGVFFHLPKRTSDLRLFNWDKITILDCEKRRANKF